MQQPLGWYNFNSIYPISKEPYDLIKDNGIEEKFNFDELGFAYRSSAYSNKNYIITSVSIRLRKDKKELIRIVKNKNNEIFR